MSRQGIDQLEYSIWDPAGNITALVESRVDVHEQPSVAAEIMQREPAVEQVGFVFIEEDPAPEDLSTDFSAQISADASSQIAPQVHLRMAGGEFCGNATMCAAALYLHRIEAIEMALLQRRGMRTIRYINQPIEEPEEQAILVDASGASKPVEVRIRRFGNYNDGNYVAAVLMPPAVNASEREFLYGAMNGSLPVIEMEGITHVIIRPDSAFFDLFSDHAAAEAAAMEWCSDLGADGLGLIFLSDIPKNVPSEVTVYNAYRLTPLVYIPGSDTIFWESSCASGSAAAGIFLAGSADKETGSAFTFAEPGGKICVQIDPDSGEIWLQGQAHLAGSVS